MGQVFKQARKVHVWLGESDETSSKVFSLLSIIAGCKVASKSSRELLYEALNAVFEDTSLYPIERFLYRPWFQRRWVIQEVALSHQTEVRCGSGKIGWNWIEEGFRIILDATHGLRGLDDTALEALRMPAAIRMEPEHILDLLWKFHKHQCFDPRD